MGTTTTTPPRVSEQADERVLPKNPHHDYLARYWQLGFDGEPMTACSGDKPLIAYQNGKNARAAITQQAAPEAPTNWISDVIRDVAELPDRDSPTDQPGMMLVSADELRDIIERHASPVAAPEAPASASDLTDKDCLNIKLAMVHLKEAKFHTASENLRAILDRRAGKGVADEHGASPAATTGSQS